MGTCSSTDSANVIESTTPETPHAATGSSRTTRNSTGHVPSGLHPQGEGRPTQRSLLFRLRRSSNENQLQRRHEHEIREIEQLQFELAAMEALFQSMLGQGTILFSVIGLSRVRKSTLAPLSQLLNQLCFVTSISGTNGRCRGK